MVGQLRTALAAQSLPPPSQSFLTTLVDSRTPPPPLASLLATAKARILACDLAQNPHTILDTSSSAASFPPDIANARAQETRLPRDVYVQVIDMENLSLSRWEQIEELEAIQRGEMTRGRQVIRVTADDGDAEEAARAAGTQMSRGHNSQANQQQQAATATATATAAAAAAARNAVHRLVLQDGRGQTVYAVEMRRMDRIGMGKTAMGEKLLLRAGAVVARGSVLLTPDKVVFLGGKVEAWQEAWASGRLARLKAAVGADRPQ